MSPYLVFLTCKVSELTGDDGLAYEVEEFILVIDVLILPLPYPDSGRLGTAHDL